MEGTFMKLDYSSLEKQDSSLDRKSTRLNSSHTVISYAVFCLKKKIVGLSHALATPEANATSRRRHRRRSPCRPRRARDADERVTLQDGRPAPDRRTCDTSGVDSLPETKYVFALSSHVGSGVRVLTAGGYDSEPRFSPDGRSIAFRCHLKLADCIITDAVAIFFFNDAATTEIYTLSLHDALPI